MRNDPDGYNAKVAAQIEESKKPENLPAGFALPSKAGGGAAADDFSYGSDDEEEEEEDDEDHDEGGADASGLTAAESRIVSQVCEMGFDREAVVRRALAHWLNLCPRYAYATRLSAARAACLCLKCSRGQCWCLHFRSGWLKS